MTPTLDILLAARAQVERGWCKGYLSDHTGRVCAIGAISNTTADRLEMSLAMSRLEDALEKPFRRNGLHPIATYNDLEATSKADILALYDRAINALVPVGDSSHVHRTAA